MRKILKILFLVVCLTFHFAGKAQEYLPLPIRNVEWSVLFTQSGSDGQIYTSRHYAPVGDTLIENKVFTKLFSNTGKEFNIDSAKYIGAYINEFKKNIFYK